MLSFGSVEVICGCMSCGKTETLIRRLRQAVRDQKHVRAIKPPIDNRFHATQIRSRSGAFFEALATFDYQAIRAHIEGADVVGFDEAQFFDPEIVAFCESLANHGVRVIIAGLDQDSDGKPFGPMPALMAVADELKKLPASCAVCGGPASKSHYKGEKTQQIVVGASEYEARCRGCKAQR